MRYALILCLTAFSLLADETIQTRVSLTSQPSGATVIVDGRDRGTTPLTLFDLKPGRHHVKYRLAGYEEKDRFFATDEGPFIEKNVVLSEEKGLLLVKTDPAGCNIAVDGVSVGTSPRLITHLAAKDTYSVKLTKTGFQPLVISVKFDGRTPLVREEKLVLDSGVVNVISEPSGAEVTVNGIVRGTTPVLVTDLPKGQAVVKLRLAGFRDETRELALKPGDQQTLAVPLAALPGTLYLTSVPSGARFYLNDEMRGTGSVAIPALAPGDYSVRAELEGYGTVTRTVSITAGESTREEFRLSNVMGRLEVRTNPADATLVFDGRTLGRTVANGEADFSNVYAIENILEGEHTLIVRKEGYKEQTRHPKIRNSKTSQANVRLVRVFIPDVEIVTDRGSYRGMLVGVTADAVTVEVSLGITRSFARSEIRKMTSLVNERNVSPKK